MEWAMPRRNVIGVECADGAVLVNATVVRGGVRCMCGAGFVGDGYAQGAGCYKGKLYYQFLTYNEPNLETKKCSVGYYLCLSIVISGEYEVVTRLGNVKHLISY